MSAPVASGCSGRRVGLAPTYLGHWCQGEIFSIADCIFAEVVDGVGVINGSFAIAANSGKVRRAASVLSLRQKPHQLISGSVIGTVTIIPHSAGEEAGRWDQSGKAAMSQVGARSHTDRDAGAPRRPRFGRSLYDAAFMTAPSGINPVSR